MKAKDEYRDPLVRLIEEHETVSEYLENFKEIMDFQYKQISWQRIEPIETFFKRNIISHFEFEEKIVFPVLLSEVATPDIIKLISELEEEHKAILAEIEEFRKIISEHATPPDKETRLRLERVGKKIIDNLLGHAAKEDDKLLPILEKNRKIFKEWPTM
jgi:iron-sulfur cluster repair protein YtfE (RIC family)